MVDKKFLMEILNSGKNEDAIIIYTLVDEVVADAFSSEEVADYAKRVIGKLQYGSNIRGSEQYRKQLSKVLIGRCISRLTEE